MAVETTRLTPVSFGLMSFQVIPFIRSFIHVVFISSQCVAYDMYVCKHDQCYNTSFLSCSLFLPLSPCSLSPSLSLSFTPSLSLSFTPSHSLPLFHSLPLSPSLSLPHPLSLPLSFCSLSPPFSPSLPSKIDSSQDVSQITNHK